MRVPFLCLSKPALCFLSAFLFLLAACSGGSTAPSGGKTVTGDPVSSITVNASPATADVDAGGTFVGTYSLSHDVAQNLKITLSGPGTIAVGTANFFGEYAVTYTAPGSVTAGSTATILAASTSDSSKTNGTAITLHDALAFPSQTPPAATLAKAYSYQLTASGGTTPLNFHVLTTSKPLPGGLDLSTSGLLSGTPTAVGSYTFDVILGDNATKPIGMVQRFTIDVS